MLNYKQIGYHEVGGRVGVKVLVALDRDLSSAEEDAIGAAIQDIILPAILKETTRLDPDTHKRARMERLEIEGCFERPIFVEEIPNGYCNRYCCSFKPWFIVTTEMGRIKIGWRKSVIHLEWTDSVLKDNAEQVFPKEEAWPGYETTQYEKIIHCHGYEKAKEYIGRLLTAYRVQELRELRKELRKIYL